MALLRELHNAGVTAKDIIDLVRKDRAAMPFWVGRRVEQESAPSLPTFIVRIDSNATGGGRYLGTLMCPTISAANTGALAMPEGMLAGQSVFVINSSEDGSTGHQLAADTYHVGVFAGYNQTESPFAVFMISSGRSYSLFPVTVSQTGGSAGDSTTQCSYTYTATDLDGNQLGTAMSPTWARPAYGAMVAGTKGVGYYNAAGDFVLYQVDEVPDVDVCT